jgi:hypothetical protein
MFNELAIAAAIVSVSLIIHMAGILLMAEWLLRRREELERNVSRRYFAGVMVMLFGGILLLHLIQTSLWALFYYTQELFSDFETSLYCRATGVCLELSRVFRASYCVASPRVSSLL